jgi:hypothetical protein
MTHRSCCLGSQGKAEVHGVAASGEVLRGGVFRSIPPGFSDFPPPHAAPVHDNAQAVIQGTAPGT